MAVLHDYFAAPDGGGRVAYLLASKLASPLVCGFLYHHHPYFTNGPSFPVIPLLRPINMPFVRQLMILWAFLRKCSFIGRFNNAIYSGFYSPMAASSTSTTYNIYYCHTPPRFLYDLRQHFVKSIPKPYRSAFRIFIKWYKPRYEASILQMHTVIANSQNVRHRIKRFLEREAKVIYPPCDVSAFRYRNPKGYYLSPARLDPLKRVDRIISAFSLLPDKRLLVTSTGSEIQKLQQMAANLPNVKIIGETSDSTLKRIMGNCIAVIYIPRDEDFGLIPVEAMAAGKPVIGVKEGGIPESVIDGETGILLPPDPQADEIAEAVNKLTAQRARSMKNACERQAKKFDIGRFIQQIRNILR